MTFKSVFSSISQLRSISLFVTLATALIVSGCVSSGGGVSSYVGPSVSSATAKLSNARKSAKEAKLDVRTAKRQLRKLERNIARAERRLKRKRLSASRRDKLTASVKRDTRQFRSAKRAVRRAERKLARAERAENRASRSMSAAKRRQKDAERRIAQDKKRRQQELARAEIERKEPKAESRSLFSLSDPALKNVQDYGARVDGGFSLAAIPIQKVNKRFYRQEVKYRTSHKPGTLIVDPHGRFLYLVMRGGKAMRYGIGVGKAGFEWKGTAKVGWKQAWPKWTPPAEMIERRPELAKWGVDHGGMPGGLDNPLGARALYLFQNGKDTLYRLHGTPQWASIGTAASSGCIRLMNQDVIDLYNRVPSGATVVVL
jgi:lipoprotein-anchoring transpeptidase ErfK/SrfK